MVNPSLPAQTPQFTRQTKIFTLIGIMLGLLLAALDNTIVATAGPSIQRDLNIEPSLYTWITTAYLVASTVMIPIYGKLSDLLGRKIVLVFGVIVFLLGSFLCGVSPSTWFLILARTVQGVGSAALFTSAFAIIADLYPPAERGRITGLFGAVFGLSSVLGPLVGGFITDNFSWHWAFFINLPLGLIALFFILTRMPALRHEYHEGEQRPRLDTLGALWLIVGVVPLLLGLSLGKSSLTPGETGFLWTSWQSLTLFGLAVLGLLAFVLTERRAKEPILDLSLFQNRVFALGNLGAFIVGGAFLGPIIFLPLFMVNVVGLSATNSGLTITPLSLGIVAGNILTGQIVTRMGKYKPLMLIGLGVLMVAFAVMAFTLTSDSTQLGVTLKMVLLGLGLGPSIPLYTLAIQNAVDVRKTGVATSSATFFRQLGNVVGVAVLGTVFANTLSGQLAQVKAQAKAELPASARSQFDDLGGGSAGGESSSTFDLKKIKQTVAGKLDEQKATITKALRDNDPQAVQKLLASDQTPQQLRDVLQGGGIAAKVHSALNEQKATITKALRDNDPQAVQKLLASKQTPQQLREVLQGGGIAAKVHTAFQDQKETVVKALRDNDPQAVQKLLASKQTPQQLREVLQGGGIGAAVKQGFEAQKATITKALRDNDPASVQKLLASDQTPQQLREVLQGGGVAAAVKQGFDRQRDLITRALQNDDPQAIQALLANPQTPQQLREVLQGGGVAAAVKQGFDRQRDLITRALQNDDPQAIQALLANPQTPQQLREVLQGGGVAAAVKQGFDRQRALLTKAIQDNDPQAVQALLANPQTPQQLREVLQGGGVAAGVQAKFAQLRDSLTSALGGDDPQAALAAAAQNPQLPGALRENLAKIPEEALQTPEGRQQVLAQLQRGLAQAQPQAVTSAKAQVLQGALAGLDKAQASATQQARQQAVQSALTGLQQAEPQAIRAARDKALSAALAGLDQAEPQAIQTAKDKAVQGAVSALDRAEPQAVKTAKDKAVQGALAALAKAEPQAVASAKTQAVQGALAALTKAEPQAIQTAKDKAVQGAVNAIDDAQPKIMKALDTFGQGFKDALTTAIRHVFAYGLIIVLLGFIASLFIPQVPLRKRGQSGPPVLD